MAYKDSDELQTNENYTLGEYSFRIERTSVPGSSNDKIEAICTDKDGKNARKSIQIPSSTQLDGWYVEANETEASVYVHTMPNEDPSGIAYSAYPPVLFKYGNTYFVGDSDNNVYFIITGEHPGAMLYLTQYNNTVYWATSANSNSCSYSVKGVAGGAGYITHYFTNILDPSSVAYSAIAAYATPSTSNPSGVNPQEVSPSTEEQTILVGRFAIELEDAGGVGPGSDWVDPGDYDPDWEEGDPTHTLYVEVTGALSGRHNDPIVDPSYSYIPSDKDTVKDYGCGGDGGHGGGGGAGASTVVVYKFATNQANFKEITARARRHGYGSGGGKGGKGGDGCILVYY